MKITLIIALYMAYATSEKIMNKSLPLNYWVINRVISKYQMDFLDKTCKKGLKQKK